MREARYAGESESFSSRYNYYDGSKHLTDYLYESSKDVLGNFKHFNLSAETLRIRNLRSRSPLVTRELDRCWGIIFRVYEIFKIKFIYVM